MTQDNEAVKGMEADAALSAKMLGKKVWAVIGANDNPAKYGNMIYKKLKSRDYEVYPVNPRYEVIEGDTCYESLSALPQKPEVINLVVSPKIGENFLREAAELGIKYVWMQPGTHNDQIMQLVDELDLTAFQGCVLVSTR